MNRTNDPKTEEHITINSPRTTAPAGGKSWQILAGIIIGIFAILAIVLLVVRIGAGGESDPTSNPADTPAELEPAPMPPQPAPAPAP